MGLIALLISQTLARPGVSSQRGSAAQRRRRSAPSAPVRGEAALGRGRDGGSLLPPKTPGSAAHGARHLVAASCRAVRILPATVLLAAPGLVHADTGRLNLRLEAGAAMSQLRSTPAESPTGLHGGMSVDAALAKWVGVTLGAQVDTFKWASSQEMQRSVLAKTGLVLTPYNTEKGTGWVETAAGVARVEESSRLGLSFGAGYQANFGRLGIGPFARYTQFVVPRGDALISTTDGRALDGTDVKMAMIGVMGSVTAVKQKKPEVVIPPPPPPPAPTLKDTDKDGVVDDADQCPGTRKGVNIDGKGCEIVPPPPPPADTDGDGVTDDKDTCPGTAMGVKVDPMGCPEPPPAPVDADKDGVPDDKDTCPGTTTGFPVDPQTGCGQLPAEAFKLPMIEFGAATAELASTSLPQLSQLASLLVANPNARLDIVGHIADDGRSNSALRRLAKKRAQVVQKELVGRGVAKSRVKAVAAREPDEDGIEFIVKRR